MIAHVDGAGQIDPSSALHIDPTDVNFSVPDAIWDGLRRRWFAVQDGECPCGGPLVFSNRQQRRAWIKAGSPAFDALVYHETGCTAVAERTRTWVYRNRRLAG